MITTTIAAIAGLVMGVLAGLWAKPTRHVYCPECFQTLSCPTHSASEVINGTPRAASRT